VVVSSYGSLPQKDFGLIQAQLFQVFGERHSAAHMKKSGEISGMELERLVEPSPKVSVAEKVPAQQSDKVRERPRQLCFELEVFQKQDRRQRQICVFSAFGVVPTKVLIFRFCLMVLKKISLSQRFL